MSALGSRSTCGADGPGFLGEWPEKYSITSLEGDALFLSSGTDKQVFMARLSDNSGRVASRRWSLYNGSLTNDLGQSLGANYKGEVGIVGGNSNGVAYETVTATGDNQGHIFISYPFRIPEGSYIGLLGAQNEKISLLFLQGPCLAFNCPRNPNYDYYLSLSSTKWTGSGQVVSCCSWDDPNMMPPEVKALCGPSYTPSESGGACVDLMLDFCAGSYREPSPTTSVSTSVAPRAPGNCCDAYVANGAFTNSPDVRKFVGEIVSNGLAQRNYTYNDKDPFFTSAIPKLCGVMPGACDKILRDDFCSKHTRESLIADTSLGLQKICGCFLPGSQYPYSDENDRSISVCDPICVQGEPIHPAYLDSQGHWTFDQCTKNLCIIDNVTVNVAEQTKDFNLTQSCGCPSSPVPTPSTPTASMMPSASRAERDVANRDCLCYLSGVTITNGKINGNINIDQSGCGKCFTFVDDIRNREQIDCLTGEVIPVDEGGFVGWIQKHILLVSLVTLVVFILILAVIGYLLQRPNIQPAIPRKVVNY